LKIDVANIETNSHCVCMFRNSSKSKNHIKYNCYLCFDTSF